MIFNYSLPGPYGDSEIWGEVSGEYVVKVDVTVVLEEVGTLFVVISGKLTDASYVIV